MAMSARRLRGLLDPDTPRGTSVFDHHVYCLASDGDIEEGVASEASSLAGTQRLSNLTLIYDSNRISIEDDTKIALTEDTAARYAAYGWHVQTVDWTHGDAHHYQENVAALADALEAAKAVTDQPTFICLKTIIGWPAPNLQGTGKAHGAALGEKEVAATKKVLGFEEDKAFQVADDVIAHTRKLIERGERAQQEWQQAYDSWAEANHERKELHERLIQNELSPGWEDVLPSWSADSKGIATRAASGKVLSAIAPKLPELWGGSADLAESNNTTPEGEPSFLPTDRQTRLFRGGPYGRVMHFGVREHAMGSIMNGLSLTKLRPFGGTFFIFSDYARPAIRLSALMELPTVFVFTHDALSDGEDGPTHQPVEHLASLRAIPGLVTLRPGDANEVVESYRYLMPLRHEPAVLVLSRQPLPTLDRSKYASAAGLARGAYVLADAPKGAPDVILIATGSEIALAVEAHEKLLAEGVRSRVVSMPSWDIFEHQTQEYRDSVLPPKVTARVAIEQASAFGWERYVGQTGRVIAMQTFGASAPLKALLTEYGFTVEKVVAAARAQLPPTAKS
jgi:transketolase